MLVDMETETVEVEIVTDTAAVARKTTTAAESDTTRVMDMMIRAAKEGISLFKVSIISLGGFLRFFTIFSFPFRVRAASTIRALSFSVSH